MCAACEMQVSVGKSSDEIIRVGVLQFFSAAGFVNLDVSLPQYQFASHTVRARVVCSSPPILDLAQHAVSVGARTLRARAPFCGIVFVPMEGLALPASPNRRLLAGAYHLVRLCLRADDGHTFQRAGQVAAVSGQLNGFSQHLRCCGAKRGRRTEVNGERAAAGGCQRCV